MSDISPTLEAAVMVAPAPYVRIPLAALITGYSAKAIERKIERGDWLEGHEYRKNHNGVTLIDMDGYVRWVEGRRHPVSASTNYPLQVLAPYVPKRQITTIPTALYRHFDVTGLLLYVGVSLSPFARLSAHDGRSHWSKSIAQVTMEWFPDRPAALFAEATAIRTEAPRHNLAGRQAR